MVKYSSQPLDSAFGALSHSTRRAILDRLIRGPATVGDLAADFTISLPAISKHLDILESANLLVRVKQGRQRICRLQPESLREATIWLERYRAFWEANFDALDAYLKQTDVDEATQSPKTQSPN